MNESEPITRQVQEPEPAPKEEPTAQPEPKIPTDPLGGELRVLYPAKPPGQPVATGNG